MIIPREMTALCLASSAWLRSLAPHEPFDNIADHGSTVVNGHLVSDPAELITTLRGLAGTATVFFKETTDRSHHAVLADRRFLTEATHTFLIRAPAEIAASCYALQGQRLTLSEIGLERAYDLYQAILAAGGAPGDRDEWRQSARWHVTALTTSPSTARFAPAGSQSPN